MKRWPRPVFLAALAITLAACVSNTATQEPVTPVTYTAPSYRSATSVGRLARLAVAPVVLDWRDSARSENATAFESAKEAVRSDTRAALVLFLAEEKGYSVVTSTEAADWPDDEARAAAGQRLGVDGIVVVERWIREPWSTWDGFLNIVLMNGPLLKSLTETNLRMSIYESASGRLVWQTEWRGPEAEAITVEWARLLVNLDNAVPEALQH